jgi:hypothetical protein
MGISTEQKRRLRPASFSEFIFLYVLAPVIVLCFCWLIWPGLIYLLSLSVLFWLIARLLNAIAALCVIGVRFGRLPRAGPIIYLVAAFFEDCIAAH